GRPGTAEHRRRPHRPRGRQRRRRAVEDHLPGADPAPGPHHPAGVRRPHPLLASNPPSISITRLASATDRPERFIGLHFMNPVPRMKLVEIIRGIATDVQTYETAVNFAKSLDKTTANAEDFPAFIVNRVLVPMINEAI